MKEQTEGNEMLITKTSLLTGITRTLDIPVTQEQMDLWLGGKVLIQNAMPNLDADDREFIMTGIIDSEWTAMGAAQEPEMDYWEYQEYINDGVDERLREEERNCLTD